MKLNGPNYTGERAPWASDPLTSLGRKFFEIESTTRSQFQRDKDRIIHSSAFRRLKHKTQVFVYHEGDHYRTRLTHSLEVAQIARSLSRFLRLDEDLAEALALAHDLGHTPFGHAGENALNEAMKLWGGFDHNGQALRIVTKLEARYAEFDGLNLTWECLEGLVKHNGPLLLDSDDYSSLPWAIKQYEHFRELKLHTQPGMEAQVAALSDDIAYNTHDIDDGLRAKLFTIDDLAELPLVGPAVKEVMDNYPNLDRSRLIHEVTRRMIDRMVQSLISETLYRLEKYKPDNQFDIYLLPTPVVAFSADILSANKTLKNFLFERMYRHYRVNKMTIKAQSVVKELFSIFLDEPEFLPPIWRRAFSERKETVNRVRIVSDYISGMTDRFALSEHERLAREKS